MLYKFFFFQLMLWNVMNCQAQNDSLTHQTAGKSNFYMAGQLFNASRSIEDLSTGNKFDSLSFQKPINTGGFELGTSINLSEKLFLTVGVNYFGGGESWSYADSLSDSTFLYNNKYRQIAVPIRLNLQFGDALKWYGFVGLIPSSILGRRYESSYTNANGSLTENDIVVDQENINAFQFIGTVGTGLSYDLGDIKIFSHIEYRRHFTNTYTGIFLKHHQKLIGGSLGLSIVF